MYYRVSVIKINPGDGCDWKGAPWMVLLGWVARFYILILCVDKNVHPKLSYVFVLGFICLLYLCFIL